MFPLFARRLGRDATYKIACVIGIVGLCILGFSAFVAPASLILLVLGTIGIKIGSGLIIGTITVLVAVIGIVGLCILGFSAFVAPASLILLVLGTIGIKIGSGLIIGTITVLVADVIDYNQLQFGMRNESIICSAQTFLVKTSMAVCGLLTGFSLTVLGYDASF